MVTQSSRWHSAHRSLEQQSPGRTGPNIIFWLPQRDLEESFGFEIQDVAEFAFGKRPKKPKPKRLLPNPPGCTFSSAFSTFALNPKPIILGNQQPPSLQFFNIILSYWNQNTSLEEFVNLRHHMQIIQI